MRADTLRTSNLEKVDKISYKKPLPSHKSKTKQLQGTLEECRSKICLEELDFQEF